jgi:REP element-mobilizing transposase RayT
MNNDFLREILNKVKNINVLEEVKDPKNVFEYLNLAANLRKEIDKQKILAEKDQIFNSHIDLENKKKLIIQLASVDDIEAYKTLEKFSTTDLSSEIKDFVTIALQESKALLQSSLLGEPTILITSGLGGKGDKLRYFIVLFTKENKPFTDFQKQIIKKEAKFFAETNDCVIEQISVDNHFVSLIMLIPFKINPSELTASLIDSINEMGNFLSNEFILRNDKIISQENLTTVIDLLISGKIKLNQIDSYLENNKTSESK